MNILISLILMIAILSIIILIHEFGHFIWAKKFGVHIYEFSLGMGDDDEKIPKSKLMCNKPWLQRVIIVTAGVINNFILALVILFVIALIWGAPIQNVKISKVFDDSSFAKAGIVAGDEILKINDKTVKNFDKTQILLHMKSKNNTYNFVVRHSDNTVEEYNIKPQTIKDKDGKKQTNFGFEVKSKVERGLWPSIKYAFVKFGNIVNSMWLTVSGLVTGKLSISSLSGPVGIYEVVDKTKALGINNIIYLIAFLSINVGFINILPLPAFDGGRLLFMVIEKIKGSPVDTKIENIVHTIGFVLLMILMLIVTCQDVIRLIF